MGLDDRIRRNEYRQESLLETLRKWSLSSGSGKRTESSVRYGQAAYIDLMRLKLTAAMKPRRKCREMIWSEQSFVVESCSSA